MAGVSFSFLKVFFGCRFLGFVSFYACKKFQKLSLPNGSLMVIKPDLPFWHPSITITNRCKITKQIKSQKILTKASCLMTFQSTNIGIGNPNPVGSGDVSEFSRGFGTFETGDFPKGIRGINNQWMFFDRFDNHC